MTTIPAKVIKFTEDGRETTIIRVETRTINGELQIHHHPHGDLAKLVDGQLIELGIISNETRT